MKRRDKGAPPPEAARLLWEKRWKARSDLMWLCHNVLDYNLIHPRVHGPMLAHLQQFPLPSLDEARERDKILDNGTFQYTPSDPYTALEGARRRMLIFSRGYFKSTCNTIAHSVQWFLNYPQIAMACLFATDTKAKMVMGPIREFFQYNKKLRELFPEYCPQIRINDWGNSESFIIQCRDDIRERLGLPPRVEPSLMSQSLEKSKAGFHFDIIKCSDIVDEENVINEESRARTKNRFGLLKNLLVKRFDGREGWIDVEGTFYHTDDLHMELCRDWMDKHERGEKSDWSIFVDGCFQRERPDGKPRVYDPYEMLKCPFKLDENGRRIPTWFEADPIEKLEVEEKDVVYGGQVFYYQRVCDVAADKSSERPFGEPLTWVRREDFNHVPAAFYITSVDLANTVKKKSNWSVILTAKYDRSGRVYVCDIQRGKWHTEEQIKRIFETYARYMPQKIIVEETGYVQGLKHSVDRYSALKGVYPPFHFAPALRTQSKIERIIRVLRPPLYTGINGQADCRFVEPLDPADESNNLALRKALISEFSDCTIFDTGKTDDIIDALAMQYIEREFFGMESLRGGAHLQEEEAKARLLKEEYEEAYRAMVFGPRPDDFLGGASDWD